MDKDSEQVGAETDITGAELSAETGATAVKRKADRYFGENIAHAGLGRESARSALTSVAGRGVNMVVQFASTIVLARILSPHDFGLVAMVTAFVLFAPVFVDLGTADATTRKSKITDAEISTMFWLNVAIGAILTILFASVSGLIGNFYNQPELTNIAFVSSLAFILTAVSIQPYALMRRAMEFHRIAVIDVSANTLSSIVSVLLALLGFGYWALVAKPIVQLTLTALGAWVSCTWLPGRPRPSLEAKELVKFGLGVTGFSVMDTLARSVDRIAIGYFNGPGQLGYYQNAFILYDNVLNAIAGPMHNVGVSSLSRLSGNVQDLKRAWHTALSSLTFFCVPVFAVLAVTGKDVVVILLGEKWALAGSLLCVFAVRGIANSVERTMGWLHVVLGRSDRWMRWGIISAACQFVALAAGLPFGSMGVAVAYTVAMFCLFVPALVYSGKPIGIGVKDVLRATAPQVSSAVVAVAIALSFQLLVFYDLHILTRIIVSGAICATVYGALVLGVFRQTAPLKLVYSILPGFALLKRRMKAPAEQSPS